MSHEFAVRLRAYMDAAELLLLPVSCATISNRDVHALVNEARILLSTMSNALHEEEKRLEEERVNGKASTR